MKQGRSCIYRQGITFDKNGNFQGITDVTNHGRADHFTPHFHPATTPNGTLRGPNGIPDFSNDPGFTLHELKPNNPRGKLQGMKQLNKYKQEADSIELFGISDWKIQLDTY